MLLTVKEDNGTMTCVFSGRMNTVNCMEIQDECNKKIQSHDGKLVFDMKDVEYISSSFLRLCASAADTAGTGNFSVSNVNPNVKKVFKIAGLEEKLNVS